MLTRSSSKCMVTRSTSSYSYKVVLLQDRKNKRRVPPRPPQTQVEIEVEVEDTDTEPIRDTTTNDREEYDVFIDFDEAHDEWMANKKRLKNGNYVYLCGKPLGQGNRKCRRGCSDGIGLYSGCTAHFMWEEIVHVGGGSPYDPL